MNGLIKDVFGEIESGLTHASPRGIATFLFLLDSYKDKAKRDVREVSKIVESLLESLGLAAGTIALREIETFCKYSAFLKVVRYRSLEDEYHQPRTKQIGK